MPLRNSVMQGWRLHPSLLPNNVSRAPVTKSLARFPFASEMRAVLEHRITFVWYLMWWMLEIQYSSRIELANPIGNCGRIFTSDPPDSPTPIRTRR